MEQWLRSTNVKTNRSFFRRYPSFSTHLVLVLFFLFGACTTRQQERLLEQGDRLIASGKHKQGVQILKELIEVDSESRLAAKAFYKLGFFLEVYEKNSGGALFHFEEFIKLNKDPVARYEVLKRMGNLYYETRTQSDRAIDIYSQLLLDYPDSLEADFLQFRLARSYFQTNNFKQAKRQYQKLIEKYPQSQYLSRARFEIGNSYYMEGKYKIAVEAMKQVLRQDPQSEHAVEAQFIMASSLDHMGSLSPAIGLYQGLKGRYFPTEVLDERIKQARRRLSKRKIKK